MREQLCPASLSFEASRCLGENLAVDLVGARALAALLQRDPKIEPRLVEIRRLLDRALEPLNRIGRLAGLHQNRAEAVGRIGVGRVDLECAPVGGLGPSEIPRRTPRVAEIGPIRRVRRIEGGGLFERGGRIGSRPASACSRPNPFNASGLRSLSARAACSAFKASGRLPAARCDGQVVEQTRVANPRDGLSVDGDRFGRTSGILQGAAICGLEYRRVWKLRASEARSRARREDARH